MNFKRLLNIQGPRASPIKGEVKGQLMTVKMIVRKDLIEHFTVPEII